jgi:tetratricopeptide (TPR) repeat protein
MLDFFLLNELRLLGDGSPADDRFKYRLDETGIDLAADYTSLGFWEDALELLEWLSRREKPTMLLLYGAGYLCSRMGKTAQAKEYYTLAAQAPRGMRFAALPFERQALENAVKIMKNDGRACNELGTLIFGIKRKTDEALGLWQEARQAAPHSPQILRNLAVGLFSRNNKDPETLSLLEEAVRLRPWDLQLIYERNLVAELQHIPPAERLEMWKNQDVAPGDWDEIYLQGVRLFNHLGEHKKALKMLMDHTFIPAEGGEAVLGAEYGNTLECLGYEALQKGKAEEALNHFAAACNSPLNIGGGSLHEVTMVPYKYGQVLCFLKLERQKEVEETCKWILRFPVDYFTQSMLPSFMYYRAMALICTGNEKEGKDLLEALKQKACKELDRKEYGQFSTTSAHSSYIPDPGEQRRVHFGILLSLAQSGVGEKEEAHRTMEEVLKLDPFKPVMKHKIQ